MTMEFRDLEAFVAVVEAGSFTSAAQRLYLTQPSVSARIAALEAACGAPLLDRGQRRAEVTPAGRLLLPYARSLLRTRGRAATALGEFLSGKGGALELAASSVPGTYLLPRFLARLRRLHPELEVRLEISDTEAALEALRAGDVEVCVVGRPVREKGLAARVVGKDRIVLVAEPALARAAAAGGSGRGAELEPEAIRRIPLVLRERGSATRATALRLLDRAGLGVEDLDVVLEVDSNAALLEAALAGIGAAFASSLAAADRLASGDLVEISFAGLPLERPLVLVTRRARTLSPGAGALVGLFGRGDAGGF